MNAAAGRPADDAGEHERLAELAVGWALHALEPEDETRFAAHLTTCSQCARTVADTQEVMAALAGELPEAEPSAGLRNRLRAAVEETEQLPQPAPPSPPSPPAVPVRAGATAAARPRPVGGFRPPRRTRSAELLPPWRRALPGALVAAAVAAILALGTWNVVLAGDRDKAESTVAQQSQVLRGVLQGGRAVVAPLTDPDRPGSSPVATVVARDGQVQVVSNGLRVNDQRDRIYVLWGIQGSSATALGTFDVVSPQIELRTVGSGATGLDDYPQYGLSIEPGRQAPSAPTDIVATGQVTS